MGSQFCQLCLALTFIAMAYADDDQMMNVAKAFAEPCFGVDGITENDFDQLFKEKEIPERKTTKCLVACVQQQFNIIQDGKFVPESFVNLMKNAVHEASKVDTIKEVAKECSTIEDTDHCELGYKLAKCFEHAAKARGVDINTLRGMV